MASANKEQKTKEVLKFSACNLELLVPFGEVLTNEGPWRRAGRAKVGIHRLQQRIIP